MWNAIPTRPQWQFANARWQTATRARLGFLRAPAGATCQLPKGDEGEETVCGRVLDQHVVHPALYDAGATKLRTHNALKFVLAQELRAEGAFVDVECRVPDLYKRLPNGEIREAILDLVVEWPGAGRRHLIDVTVRCPHAARYPTSASRVGTAAAAGDKDKRDHYGPTVSPFAVESFGRFGEGARICLADLAADAIRYGKARIGRVVGLDVKNCASILKLCS